MSTCSKPCSGFCWKNPVHLAIGLAVLPFALQGLAVVWGTVTSILGLAVAK